MGVSLTLMSRNAITWSFRLGKISDWQYQYLSDLEKKVNVTAENVLYNGDYHNITPYGEEIYILPASVFANFDYSGCELYDYEKRAIKQFFKMIKPDSEVILFWT